MLGGSFEPVNTSTWFYRKAGGVLESCLMIKGPFWILRNWSLSWIWKRRGNPSMRNWESTLLNKLTGTFSEVASYEFTTLTCILGVIMYRGAKIQLLDLPGIIEGAKYGKGRG
ncbi:hypothetical protein ACOSQ2_022403 [Xanthoceras sorbifolium]